MQIGFMHAAKRSQERAQRRSRSFTTITMHFAYAIVIVITRPLVLRVIDRGVLRLDPVVTAILVRVDDRPLGWHGFS